MGPIRQAAPGTRPWPIAASTPRPFSQPGMHDVQKEKSKKKLAKLPAKTANCKQPFT
jgi:hypothetical protein